jgi:hypothetical protein
MTNALIRARIPYLPVHVDDIDRQGRELSVLILPDVAAMSDAQCASVRRFVDGGGHLVATGHTSLYNEWGDPRSNFALSDLFGVERPAGLQPLFAEDLTHAKETLHSYLRLPEGRRHSILNGFDETNILPFGGRLERLEIAPDAEVLLTYIPPFPVYPPETAWMRTARTDVAGLIVRTTQRGSRLGYMAADLDRRFGRDNLPDHAHLLANLVRWAAGDSVPLSVEGPGLIDCHLYHQPGRMVLHLVNLTNAGTWRAPVDELVPVGPLRVRMRLATDVVGANVSWMVNHQVANASVRDGWLTIDATSVLDHEVIVIT